MSSHRENYGFRLKKCIIKFSLMKWLEDGKFKAVMHLGAFIFFGGTLLWMLKALFLGLYPDFSVYYYGSQLFLSGQNPYLSGQKLFSGYSYPPSVFLLFVPFVLLPFQTSQLLWVFLNVLCLIASIVLLAKLFSVKFFSDTNLILSGFIFISFPVKFTLGMGQINILILFFLVLSLYFLKVKNYLFGGVFLGLSLVIKLFPLLLPVYFLLKLNKKILTGLLAIFGAAFFCVIIFVPEKTNLYFFHNVVPYFFSASWKLDYYSQSLSAFIGRTFGTGIEGNFLRIVITIIIIFITFFVIFKKSRNDFETLSLEYGLLITATMLINTFSWQHHFVWLIIPFYALTVYLLKNKMGKLYFLLLTISYFLVAANLRTPEDFPPLVRSHVFFGAVFLFILGIKILLTKKQNN